MKPLRKIIAIALLPFVFVLLTAGREQSAYAADAQDAVSEMWMYSLIGLVIVLTTILFMTRKKKQS